MGRRRQGGAGDPGSWTSPALLLELPSGEPSPLSAGAQGARCVPLSQHLGSILGLSCTVISVCVHAFHPRSPVLSLGWRRPRYHLSFWVLDLEGGTREARADLDPSEGGARWSGERAGRDQVDDGVGQEDPWHPHLVLAWEPVERRWLGKPLPRPVQPPPQRPSSLQGPQPPSLPSQGQAAQERQPASPRPGALVWEGASYELIPR